MYLLKHGFEEIKKIIKKALNLGYYPDIEYKCKTITIGSDYGGWSIPADFIDVYAIIYSFGVGQDISFDLGLINKLGVTVHAFDPTPKSIAWINTQNLPPNFRFYPVGLANFDGEALFVPPDNPDFVSFKMITDHENKERITFPVKSLTTIMEGLGHVRIDILKMDIEGAEYAVIEDIKKTNIRPKIILVEFHHRWSEFGVNMTKQAINILREMGYLLFYVSARDEFGFLLSL